MIVRCENCSTKFRLPDDKIGSEGTKVRCSKCSHSFRVMPGAQDDSPFPADVPFDDLPGSEAPEAPETQSADMGLELDVDELDVFDPDELGVTEVTTEDTVQPDQGAVPELPGEDMFAPVEAVGGDPFADLGPDAPAAVTQPDAAPPPEPADDILSRDTAQLHSELFSADVPDDDGEAADTTGLDVFGGDGGVPDFVPTGPPDPEATLQVSLDAKAVTAAPQTGELSQEAQQQVDAEAAPSRPRLTGTIVTGLSVLLLVFALFYFVAGERLFAGSHSSMPPLPKLDDVHVISMRSLKYPTRAGSEILVISGEAENRSKSNKGNIYVKGELRYRSGKVLLAAKAPLGVSLEPSALALVTDTGSVEAALLAAAKQLPSLTLEPGQRASYTVVIPNPPRHVAKLVHALSLEKGEPFYVPEPEPNPEVLDDPDDLRKGKRKRKAKRRKGKRKAKGDDTAAAGEGG